MRYFRLKTDESKLFKLLDDWGKFLLLLDPYSGRVLRFKPELVYEVV